MPHKLVSKALGSSASQLRVGGVLAVFGGAQSHARVKAARGWGTPSPVTGLTRVASQHSARPWGEAP